MRQAADNYVMLALTMVWSLKMHWQFAVRQNTVQQMDMSLAFYNGEYDLIRHEP